MLAKKYRLTKQGDFKEVFSKGRGLAGRFFSIRYAPNTLENSRFAVVVANRVSKKATQRNRLKRQVREIIYLNLDKICGGNFDIIVNALFPALNKEFSNLEGDLLAIFKKINLFNDKAVLFPPLFFAKINKNLPKNPFF
mgnify:CR=1 FL=1